MLFHNLSALFSGVTPWTEWSTCTTASSCGTGTRSRSRDCEDDDCQGTLSENESCNLRGCESPAYKRVLSNTMSTLVIYLSQTYYILGGSEVGAWGTCSVTCGGGSKYRSASCSDGECDSSLLQESADCNLKECSKFKRLIILP